MANAGPNDNQSQFFFTLGATPELNGKHTIFGKVILNLACIKEDVVDSVITVLDNLVLFSVLFLF